MMIVDIGIFNFLTIKYIFNSKAELSEDSKSNSTAEMKTKREVKYVVVWELKKNKCLLKICLNFVKIAPSHFHPPHFLLFLLFYYLSHTYSNIQKAEHTEHS